MAKRKMGHMKSIVYRTAEETASDFRVEWDEEGKMTSCRHAQDADEMNWVRGKEKWGTVKCEPELSVKVERRFTEKGRLEERYIISNDTDFDIYTHGTMVGIYTPFADYYTDAAVCMKQCCNTHIWCGGRSSYICALKMGGSHYNLGLVLTEGSLQGYSVERDISRSSNDRGDFIIHPENLILHPGESYIIAWELFWFVDKDDFKTILCGYPGIVQFKADNFTVFGDEPIRFRASVCGFDGNGEQPQLFCNGEKKDCRWENGVVEVEEKSVQPGEYTYEVVWKGQRSFGRFLKFSDLDTLAKKRCEFIAQKQQCLDEKSCLYGAYLIYDNEEKRQYYSHWSDHNAGRERVGMGVLLALYLQSHEDTDMEKSLDCYVEYVLRELVDEETGEVFNDAGRNQEWKRLYNYPWAAVLFMEMFALKKDPIYLKRLHRCMKAYYEEGGNHFYAIGIPMRESVNLLRREGMEKEAEELLSCYRGHGDIIAEKGTNYPAHEVNYEQSIVAPAANYMCELFLLTGEEKYREAAKKQLEVLALFQGFQPDYHQNEVAIRHWDGYWFGKRKCYGDTFPHYWSALSGTAYSSASEIEGLEQYASLTAPTLRGPLSMFGEDGSASCAMVFPMSVNGKEAGFYDPWANDQDWGMYYMLKNKNKAMQGEK